MAETAEQKRERQVAAAAHARVALAESRAERKRRYSVTVKVTVREGEYDALKAEADRREMPLRTLAREILETYVANNLAKGRRKNLGWRKQ